MINTIYALRQRRAKERWKSVKEQILYFTLKMKPA